MPANRVIASELNALNREMHEVAAWMQPDEWLTRSVPGTNLPAFTWWHVARVVDSTANLALRGRPEIITSEPWASKAWARSGIGTGFTRDEADAVARDVVAEEVLAYADAIRSQTSQWLRTASDEELDAPAQLMDRMQASPAYNRPAILESIAPFEGQPAWSVLAFACFAHGWAHLEEIRVLTEAARARPG